MFYTLWELVLGFGCDRPLGVWSASVFVGLLDFCRG